MIGICYGSLENDIGIVSLKRPSAPSIRLHKEARIRVHAATPAIPQIARRSYRSRTRGVRRRTSVLSISPKESDALGKNERSAACNENPLSGRTRLEFRLVREETFKRARDYPRTDNRLYRFIRGRVVRQTMKRVPAIQEQSLPRDRLVNGSFEIASCERRREKQD